MRATWKRHEKHGTLTMQSDLPNSVYAYPKERKETSSKKGTATRKRTGVAKKAAKKAAATRRKKSLR